MSHLNSNSTEGTTSATGSLQASSPLNSSNDGPAWSPPGQPIAKPRSKSNSAAGSGGGDRQGPGNAKTYQGPLESGPANLDPPTAVASLSPAAGRNNSPSTRTSETRPPDISIHPPLQAASLSPSSTPATAATTGHSPSTGLRINIASPAQAGAPTPPPKSPRHSPHFGLTTSDEVISVTSSMGSGQSKVTPPARAPSPENARRQAQQAGKKQQHLHPETNSESTSASCRGASAVPSVASARTPSPSPQAAHAFASRLLSPTPVIITSTVSQAPSSTSNGQPNTPTSMTGSFGSGATKLMRKFAGRRKKSEDATALFGMVGQGKVGDGPSHKASQSLFDGGPRAIKEASSLQPVALASSTQKSIYSPLPVVTLAPTTSPPATRTPSPLSMPTTTSSALEPVTTSISPQELSIHPNRNRSSLIALSPGISSAVNFMRTLPVSTEPKGEETADAGSGSISSARFPPSSAPATTSSHPVSPVKEKRDSREGKTSRETKESWRKSDSTIGHHTIRQGANGSSRPSRPVSMAESFQSAYTVVPGASASGGNKRWSTLTADMEFGVMMEEVSEDVEGELRQPSQSPPGPGASSSGKTSSPMPSAKQQNRRSVSLNVGILGSADAHLAPSFVHGNGKVHNPHEIVPLSYSASDSSTLPTPKPQQHQHPTSTATTYHGQSQGSQQSLPSNNAMWRAQSALDKDPRQHSSNQLPPSTTNLRPRFGWPSSSSRTSTAPPSAMPPLSNSAYSHVPVPGPRQPTISLSNSLAPAAGLAKQAAKKLGGIGKKWGLNNSSSGSGYSSSASSRDAAWSSSQSQIDHGQGLALGRTNSNQSSLASSMRSGTTSLSSFGDIVHRVQLPSRTKDKKNRHTPKAPSGAYSLTSSITSTSTSESDAFIPSSGPLLGVMVRGPLKTKQGALLTGAVFGRDLKTAVEQTMAVIVSNLDKDAEGRVGGEREQLVREVQNRKLPALVTRCAQHLLIWGVQEEGLFRVSGRASHISRLRAEFDGGMDYDMTSCNPGDLDPHAVASVFKAYLRELPEPILTHHLYPLFEAAVTRELEVNPPGAVMQSKIATRQPGLPSSPKNNVPPIRKPPSLSTLAMPSFNGMPAASKTLVHNLRSLIAQLPEENRDLARTVVQLMKATYQASKETKMPLSNLLLVFCPSLNMSPPLLKALCECEDIWEPAQNEEQVLDIKRETVMFDIRPGDDEDVGDELESQSVQSAPSDQPSSDYHASMEGSPIPTESTPNRPSIPTIYLDTQSHYSSSSFSSVQEIEILNHGSYMSSPPPLSSSAESVVTPTSSSGHPSLPDLPMSGVKPSLSRKSSINDLLHPDNLAPGIVRLDSTRRVARETIGNEDGDGDFPSSPPLTTAQKRRSMALLSLSGFSAISSATSNSHDSEERDLRGKKPSLRRLFTKRSTASLTSNHSGSNNANASVRASVPLQHSPGLFASNPSTPRSASDSSTVSTPISAVTAPQSTTSMLPPVLDMDIDSGTSLSFDLGLARNDSSDDLHLQSTPGRAESAIYASVVTSRDPLYGQGDTKYHYTRTRSESTASTASSNHLGIMDSKEDEDWMSTVLAAACGPKM